MLDTPTTIGGIFGVLLLIAVISIGIFLGLEFVKKGKAMFGYQEPELVVVADPAKKK